jgi:hypothetical protein
MSREEYLTYEVGGASSEEPDMDYIYELVSDPSDELALSRALEVRSKSE